MQLSTVAEIVSDAAVELSLATADIENPFSSSEPSILLLLRLLKRAGKGLVGARDWSHLQREHTFSTANGTASYALPSDYMRMKGDTQWNRNTHWPLGQPVGAAGWQTFLATTVGGTLERPYRIHGNQLSLHPTPTGIETIAYEYGSSLWVIPTGQTWPTGCTSKPTAATDTPYFEEALMVAALKLLWKQAKGFDTAAAQTDFNQAYEAAAGDDGVSPVVNVLGGRGGVRLIDWQNLPDTGYGS